MVSVSISYSMPHDYILDVPLLGFRLSRRRFRDISVEADGSMFSRELNVRLRPEGRLLRLIDLRTGEPIPTRPERIAFYQARFAVWEAQPRSGKRSSPNGKPELAACRAERGNRPAHRLLRKPASTRSFQMRPE